MRIRLTLLLVALASSCAAKKIPGTEIDDNTTTRSILEVISKYRIALERRDSQTIIDLTDETFRDDGGTSSPDDDLDRGNIYAALPNRLLKLDEIRVDISVRKIEFDETENNARVTYTWTTTFNMPNLASKSQNASDIKQMVLKRNADNSWKIVSGI